MLKNTLIFFLFSVIVAPSVIAGDSDDLPDDLVPPIKRVAEDDESLVKDDSKPYPPLCKRKKGAGPEESPAIDKTKETPRKPKVRALQKALGDPRLSALLSPNSKGVFDEVTKDKRISDRKVVNPETIHEIEKGKLFTPFARRYYSRQELGDGLKKGIFTHLSDMAFVETGPLEPETIEEKEARKKKQLEFFAKANKADLSGLGSLIDKEAMLWKSFVEYILTQIDEIKGRKRGKIRPEELKFAAESGPLKDYQYVEVEGKKFYYHSEFLDFTKMDGDEISNVEKMKKGNNPIGPDGLIMQVHHITIREDCNVFAYLTSTLHQGDPVKKATGKDGATFHPSKDFCYRMEIDRPGFAKLVSEANKSIAKTYIPIAKAPVAISIISSSPSVLPMEEESDFSMEDLAPSPKGYPFSPPRLKASRGIVAARPIPIDFSASYTGEVIL